MALVFGDSFDHYQAADILKKWSASNATAIDIAPEYALPPHGAGLLLAGNSTLYLEKTLPAPLTTFVAGLWFRMGVASATGIIFAGMDSAIPANIHVSVRYDATGHITVCRDATVLATSTNTMSLNTWYHIEFKATIDNAAGTYEVRVDGSATNWIAAATSKDTQNSGNANIGAVRLYSRVGNDATPTNHRYQDFYILDTTGTQASDFLGPCRFQVLRPAGVGATAEWAANYADNWQNVCDPFADSDSTFNQSSTAGQTDQFVMSDVPAGTVHAIQHVIMARRDAGGARTIRPVTRIGTTDYNGTTVTLPATYIFVTEPVMFSPATGGATAWDDDELNDAQFGYGMVS